MATEKTGVCGRRLKALGILAVAGAAIFIVVDYILLRLRASNVKIGIELRDAALGAIALSAVAVSVWQGWLMRRQARLSVKPWLEFKWADDDQPATGSLILANNGLGPAVVAEVRVAINDGSLDVLTADTAKEIWRSLGCKLSACTIPSQDGTSLRAGRDLMLLKGLPPLKAGSRLKTLRATVSFASMYGESAPVVSTTFVSPE
ncbi:hypothetical protein KAW44_04625 [Candidatus Bipolaricaulota bacterium]|nr:hypothetical protein [Candidatus Bipolaricaulota bacterium]